MLIFIILIFIIWFRYRYTIWTFWHDWKFKITQLNEPWKPYINNNMSNTKNKYKSLCFITLEDRIFDFIQLHNKSIDKYINMQNQKNTYKYGYVFKEKCTSKHYHVHNPYWCKFFMLRDMVEDTDWDYIVWIDSDTVINDYNFDLVEYLGKFNSDCFSGCHENIFRAINSGIVIIRNTPIGKKIIQEITDVYTKNEFFKKRCMLPGGKLRGGIGQTCYEQGVINEVLIKKYANNTTILLPDIVHNTNGNCEGKFIIHRYGCSSEKRKKCFERYI